MQPVTVSVIVERPRDEVYAFMRGELDAGDPRVGLVGRAVHVREGDRVLADPDPDELNIAKARIWSGRSPIFSPQWAASW